MPGNSSNHRMFVGSIKIKNSIGTNLPETHVGLSTGRFFGRGFDSHHLHQKIDKLSSERGFFYFFFNNNLREQEVTRSFSNIPYLPAKSRQLQWSVVIGRSLWLLCSDYHWWFSICGDWKVSFPSSNFAGRKYAGFFEMLWTQILH